MFITKNGKTFAVVEQKTQWKVTNNTVEGLSVAFNISKGIAPTFADLEKYVAESAAF
jgi:hypothetical protein